MNKKVIRYRTAGLAVLVIIIALILFGCQKSPEQGLEESPNLSMIEQVGETNKRGPTPEIFFGYAFGKEEFGQSDFPKGKQDYLIPPNLQLERDFVFLNGTWYNAEDYMETVSDHAGIVLIFGGKEINIVAEAEQPVRVQIRVAGMPVSNIVAGTDVEDSVVKIQEHKSYSIVKGPSYGISLLEIIAIDPGLRIYKLTFE